MSAYFETGFSVRKPMWHGQGDVLDTYPESWDEARLAAGLMWEPCYLDLYVPRHVASDADWPEGAHKIETCADGSYIVCAPVEGHRAIARDDTMEVLATPTDSFELIYHAQMGELLDAYTAAWRKAGAAVKFETAGVLKGGRLVWALVYLDEPYTVAGDDSPTYPFAALLNAHDGSAACKLLPTQVRIVCWNTWNAASVGGDISGHQVVIRHSGDVAARVEDAKRSLSTMRDEAKEWQIMAADLASINVSDAIVRMFVDEFIPIPENASERTRSARADRQSTFLRLYNESPTMDGVHGNAYGLVQAAGEYLDHMRPFQSHDTYLARTMFRPEPIKTGVVKLVRELVAAN